MAKMGVLERFDKKISRIDAATAVLIKIKPNFLVNNRKL